MVLALWRLSRTRRSADVPLFVAGVLTVLIIHSGGTLLPNSSRATGPSRAGARTVAMGIHGRLWITSTASKASIAARAPQRRGNPHWVPKQSGEAHRLEGIQRHQGQRAWAGMRSKGSPS